MNRSNGRGRVLAVYAMSLSLAGCSLAGSTAPTVQRAAGARAMSSLGKPTSTSGDLLYVSDAGKKTVYFYSYPAGTKIGQLTGIGVPIGLCADGAGNIFVANVASSNSTNILEFAHGGSTAAQTLNDPGMEPSGCAVSPTTGDLAVTNVCPFANGECQSGRGNVLVYPEAKGTPQKYSSSLVSFFRFCGYDAAGELYVDGSGKGIHHDHSFELLGLPKQGGRLKQILVHWPNSTSTAIEEPGGIQWDGTHLGIGSAGGEHIIPSVYRVNTSNWKIASVIKLNKSHSVYSFFIDGKTLIAPNVGKQGQVLFYSYPKGVKSNKVIDGLSDPVSVVVSSGTHD